MTPCPSCGADRGHLLGCERSTLSLAPSVPTRFAEEPASTVDTTRLRVWGVPIALAAATLVGLTGPGQFLLRVMFGMWLHELGHATASWFCGVFAVPLPWITLGGHARSPVFVALLVGALGFVAYRKLLAPWVLALPAAMLLVGLIIPFRHATTFIVFFGDGGALVFGTVLMLGAMLLPDEHRLARGGLRWGYLVIGAGAFMDAFLTWFRSWRDVAELPFGRSESSGLSDALRLVDESGWSERGMIRAYLALSVLCLSVLAITFSLSLRQRGEGRGEGPRWRQRSAL
jgi:hypothetical protein